MSAKLDELLVIKETLLQQLKFWQRELYEVQVNHDSAAQKYRVAFNAYRELLYIEWEEEHETV